MNYQPSIPQRTVYGEDIVSAGRERGTGRQNEIYQVGKQQHDKTVADVAVNQENCKRFEPKSICGEFRVNDETNCVRDATK